MFKLSFIFEVLLEYSGFIYLYENKGKIHFTLNLIEFKCFHVDLMLVKSVFLRKFVVARKRKSNVKLYKI